MTTGKEWKKTVWKNWKHCSFWKLPFRNHGAIKLTHNCVGFTNPCINLFVPTSVTREYHPKVHVSTYCSVGYSAHLQESVPWKFSLETLPLARHNTSILNFVPSWSHATENRSNANWRPCSEDRRMQHQWVRKKPTVHPAVPSSNTLSWRLRLSIQFIQTRALQSFWERPHKLLHNSSRARHLA